MTEHSTHDVVVVGARAAGAATAMLLARAGLDVLVVDRSRYGSDTLSTHALMRTGVVQLHRWGLLDDIIAAGTPAVRSTTFRFADEELRITIKPSHGVDALYAPRRTVLDPILVDAARAAGASFAYGTSITDVVRDRTGRVVGVAGRDGRGRAVRHTAGWIVGADGLRSVVADAVGSTIERRGSGATAVVYGYSSGLVTDSYHWIFRPEACAGLIPTNGDRTCVFAASTPARVGRGGPDALHAIVRAAEPELADRLSSATPLDGVRTFGGLPGFIRLPWGPGWALVGDAAYWKDPLGAHGLTDALRDAEILARAIIAVTLGDAAESDALHDYHRTRNRLSLPLFDVVDTIAAMRWNDAEIPELLRQLSSTMSDEVEFVARFDDEPAVSGALR
jgi:2-polyprenyl-6-methoxyphenol hydroxylase-like FAD-dependent oxidoreductase